MANQYDYFFASFKDVLRIPEFSGMTVYDLLPREMDQRVVKYFYPVGCDIDHTPLIQACRHKSNSEGVVLSYRYVLPMRRDKEWLSDKNCTLRTRIASQEDQSLSWDMIKMSAEGTPFGQYQMMCIKAGKSGVGTVGRSRDAVDPEYKDSLEYMKHLRKIQIDVRGPLASDEDMIKL